MQPIKWKYSPRGLIIVIACAVGIVAILAAFIGLNSYFNAQRAKERKRVQEVRNEGERVRDQMIQNQRRVDAIGKSAEKTAAKLVKLGRMKELLQVQFVVRTNFAKAKAAEAQFQRNILLLDKTSMSKKQKSALKAANAKLTLERNTAIKIIEVNKLAQLQIRAKILIKKGGRRTENEKQIIVAASLQRIKKMKAAEKALEKKIKKMRKARE